MEEGVFGVVNPNYSPLNNKMTRVLLWTVTSSVKGMCNFPAKPGGPIAPQEMFDDFQAIFSS